MGVGQHGGRDVGDARAAAQGHGGAQLTRQHAKHRLHPLPASCRRTALDACLGAVAGQAPQHRSADQHCIRAQSNCLDHVPAAPDAAINQDLRMSAARL